jgi:pimeloyl-ACP methyl ester carboxylesterase
MNTVVSKDGTSIAYDKRGDGPAVVLVDGALCSRAQGPMPELAALLAAGFTVYNYDRRGRGDSGDAAEYEVDREIEDLAALLAVAGGTAYLFGASSGAVLAADAAHRLPGFTRLALYEPPFIVDDTHAPRPETFLAETEALIAAGDTGGAVKKFLRSVDMPGFAVRILSVLPPFRKIKAAAHTLPYDLRILGDTGRGRPLDAARWSGVSAPAIVLDGGRSPRYMRHAARAFSQALPKAGYRTLPGQTHLVKASVVAPAVREFLGG